VRRGHLPGQVDHRAFGRAETGRGHAAQSADGGFIR